MASAALFGFPANLCLQTGASKINSPEPSGCTPKMRDCPENSSKLVVALRALRGSGFSIEPGGLEGSGVMTLKGG